MKFVTGGAYQGKRETAARLFDCPAEAFADGGACAYQELLRARAVYRFHELIRRAMRENYPLDALLERLWTENPDILIVSDEVGYGVVPIDPRERAFREQAGRISCRIAEQADTVVRVTAGIPQVLKGRLP